MFAKPDSSRIRRSRSSSPMPPPAASVFPCDPGLTPAGGASARPHTPTTPPRSGVALPLSPMWLRLHRRSIWPEAAAARTGTPLQAIPEVASIPIRREHGEAMRTSNRVEARRTGEACSTVCCSACECRRRGCGSRATAGSVAEG
jgi:hypothetical protein